jgi:hypothetical protein
MVALPGGGAALDFNAMTQWVALAWFLLAPAAAAAAGYGDPLDPGARVAFLGMGFVDTSTEGAYDGVRDDQTARLRLVEEAVRTRFREEGFALLPTDPVAPDLAQVVNPADCAGCELRLAEKLGADYVVVGEVQKVSNLILSMNLVLREVPSGMMLRGLSVDFRSNTDETWLRAMRYILRYNFFKA